MSHRALRFLLVLAVVVAMTPAVGGAAPRPTGAAVPSSPEPFKDDGAKGVHALDLNSYAPDVYETPSDGHDGISSFGNVRDITASIPRLDADTPGWGKNPYAELHSLDTANVTGWDEDWVKFVVTPADMAAWEQLSFRIDAWTPDRDLDLCLDVFRNGDSFSTANRISGEDTLARVSNDDSAWGVYSTYGAPERWASVSFVPTSAATYWVRVRPYWAGAATGFTGHAGPYTLRIKAGQVERLAGATRIDTAVRISQETWPTKPANSQDTSVVIAYSMNYPDALAAASLAGVSGGPILLSPGDHLPTTVRNEIQRIGAKGAYIVGGTGAIQNTVIEDLQIILAPSRIKRVAGINRYATSVEVFKETRSLAIAKALPAPNDAFLASGLNYPDALALGPISWRDRVPILLTPPTSLDETVASAIAMYGITDVVIAGGTGAVGAIPADELIDIGLPPNRILRVAGSNRYETAKEIAAWACDLKGPGPRGDGMVGTTNNTTSLARLPNPAMNAFASGESYPDALAGGAFAGKAGAPILLTPKSSSTPFLFGADGEIPAGSTQWFSDLATNGLLPIVESYLLGGSGAVSDDIWVEIDNNTGWDPGF